MRRRPGAPAGQSHQIRWPIARLPSIVNIGQICHARQIESQITTMMDFNSTNKLTKQYPKTTTKTPPSSTTSIPSIRTKQTTTPIGAFISMVVCVYCLLIAPTLAIFATENGDFNHHSRAPKAAAPESQSRNDIFSLGEPIPLIFNPTHRFYNNRHQILRDGERIEEEEEGRGEPSTSVTNLLANQRSRERQDEAGDSDMGADDNIYKSYSLWNGPSSLDEQVAVNLIDQEDDDDIFNADDIDQKDILVGDEDPDGRLTINNHHLHQRQQQQHDEHDKNRHQRHHHQKHDLYHKHGHPNHHKKHHRPLFVHMSSSSPPPPPQANDNVASNDADDDETQSRDQRQVNPTTVERNHQVPEQSPIVVSSSDNSYVSASPIISNEIISTTATTTSSSSSSHSGGRRSKLSGMNTNRRAERKKRRRKRRKEAAADGTTIASNTNQGHSTLSDYSIIDIPEKTTSDELKKSSTHFTLPRASAPVILGNFRSIDQQAVRQSHEDQATRPGSQSLHQQLDNRIKEDDKQDQVDLEDDDDLEDHDIDDLDDEADQDSDDITPSKPYTPFNLEQNSVVINADDAPGTTNDKEFYNVDGDNHEGGVVVDASSQARYSNVRSASHGGINGNRLSSLLPGLNYAGPRYYGHDDSHLASIEIEQEVSEG